MRDEKKLMEDSEVSGPAAKGASGTESATTGPEVQPARMSEKTVKPGKAIFIKTHLDIADSLVPNPPALPAFPGQPSLAVSARTGELLTRHNCCRRSFRESW